MRRAVNYVGRFLFTGGTLLLIFVAYQLWGTGIYEAQQQSDLRSHFKTALAETRQAQQPVSGTTTTTSPRPPPAVGDAVAIIQIPKIGLDRTVVQGVSVPDLRKGPGHYPDSPLPGQLGNAAIAGHRTTYGQPFNRIDELTKGDEIRFLTLYGTYTYRVTQNFVVSPKQVDVLDPTPDATLTLTTCNPKFSATERLIIKATLDVKKSPKPIKPSARDIRRHRVAIDDLAGTSQSRLPVIWSGLLAAAVGGLWWFVFHRRKQWYVWVAGAIPFLAAYAVFCFFLERVLPPGF